MFWTILVLIVISIIGIVVYGNNKNKKNDEILEGQGYLTSNKVSSGRYLAGHPELDSPIVGTVIYSIDSRLAIMQIDGFNVPTEKAKINVSDITNISVEDNTTIEKRVTVARLLLTGIFAFALRKSKKKEVAYLVIDWKSGKFNHETIFQFESDGAMQKANTARNGLIRFIK